MIYGSTGHAAIEFEIKRLQDALESALSDLAIMTRARDHALEMRDKARAEAAGLREAARNFRDHIYPPHHVGMRPITGEDKRIYAALQAALRDGGGESSHGS